MFDATPFIASRGSAATHRSWGAPMRTSAKHKLRTDAFTINGRFLSQPVTGVQRYAREVAAALDGMLAEKNETACMLTPGTSGGRTAYQAINCEGVSSLRGLLWEQVQLPRRRSGPVLNLCNMAPLAIADQVVCIHDINTFLQPESYSASFRLLYRLMLPLIARRAARLTTVSTFSANMIAWRLGVRRTDIHVLPNGHDHVWRWSAAASTIFARHSPRRPYVLLIGSRAKHKNILGFMLSMAPALEELGLDIWIAGGSSAIFTELDIECPPNVNWLGVVSDDDLAALYGGAFCLAFPSLTEGFGLPLIEAMALGCPVIASDRASMPEVCGNAALLADPADPGAWLAEFSKLIYSPSLRSELIDKGRLRAADFTWTKTAREYRDLLRDIVA